MTSLKLSTHFALLTAFSLGLVLTGTSTARPADDYRMFAELTAKNGTCIDWEAEGSRRIVAHRHGNDADVIQFGTPTPGGFGPWFVTHFTVRDDEGNVILDLTDTTWVRVPVLHITESGAEHVSQIYWLVETDPAVDAVPPTTGVTAGAGPGGEVSRFVSFGIGVIDSGDPYGNSGKYRIFADGAGDVRFCVSVGSFNK